MPPLPPPPRISLAIAHDRTRESRADGGFLNVRRLEIVASYPNGSASRPFQYDMVDRASIDAVVVVAHERGAGGREVYVRSAARVPLLLHHDYVDLGNTWELPAGMIDPGESPREGAARELEEELGYRVDAASLVDLGPWTWPTPAMIAERHFFFSIDVTGMPRGTPTEDGSPLESGAAIQRIPLPRLLDHCRAGELRDAKTELALRRFAERA